MLGTQKEHLRTRVNSGVPGILVRSPQSQISPLHIHCNPLPNEGDGFSLHPYIRFCVHFPSRT